MTVAVNDAAMLGGPALAGLLRLTTMGVPCTSTWPGKGPPAGATENPHRTRGERIPGAITLTQFGSFGGSPQGTQPLSGSQYVSFLQSSSPVHGTSGTHTPCEQICVAGSHGTVQSMVPPLPPVPVANVPPPDAPSPP